MTNFSFELELDARNMVCAPFSANTLPAVSFNDLEYAWRLASIAAELDQDGEKRTPIGVIFSSNSPKSVELQFNDYDAICWTGAIHNTFNIKTVRGLSVCLRMLGLFQVMAEASWSRPFYSFDRYKKLKINNALLTAAAITNLTSHGSFDYETMRKETITSQLNNTLELNQACNAKATTAHR